MVYFQTKNANLGKFWKVLQSNMFVNFTDISSILLPFVIFYGHLIYFEAILVYFYSFGMLYQRIWQPWITLSSAYYNDIIWFRTKLSQNSRLHSEWAKQFLTIIKRKHLSTVPGLLHARKGEREKCEEREGERERVA
jgi:hypothetical protein